MKIIWNQNPLKTVIELEPLEIELLRHKLMIEEMEWAICGGWMHLDADDKDWYDPVKARDELKHEYWHSDKYKARIQEMLDYYVAELKGIHSGDCTCVPCSCDKCHAEGLLGLNTTKGLGNHEGSKVNAAFSYKDADGNWCDRTIDEAIAQLEKEVDWSYEALPADSAWKTNSRWDKAQYEYHIPRWKKERENALAWLKNYREEHKGDFK